jgi:Tol biopolymer transport system component
MCAPAQLRWGQYSQALVSHSAEIEMKKDLWQRAEELFHAALERPPEARKAFIDKACGEDVELQRHVEILISKDAQAGSFLEKPVLANMSGLPMVGQIISHYRIIEKLGQGGMGEVYRAHDSKLGRDVAIKVLPAEFAKDADRVARFQREARLLASLNHPNIAAIHGLEEFGGTGFLVLELVEGQTLAEYIAGSAGVLAGKNAAETAAVPGILDLALQIAEALEAAHEKGIIHRDLKPANIKVTPEGKVKVLDFGLAKAFAGEQAEVNLSNSPTLSELATQQGVILGTAAYMSPEQARGKTVDKRADIWAFGCVLFEMISGSAAFSGNDVTDILAAVIRAEPDWEKVPARVRPLLRRCLQKDPGRRLRDISDVKLELEEVLANPSEVPAPPVAAMKPRTKLRMMLPWLAAAVVLAAIIAGSAIWRLKPQDPRPITRFSCFLTPDQTLLAGYMQTIAISPDGSSFVCATNKGLYLRRMDQLQGGIIPGTEGNVRVPCFSPDGQWVGFWSERDKQLKKIPIKGGSPVTICDAQVFYNAFWNADNTILFDSDTLGSIMRVSANRGTPERILECKNEYIVAPQLLPDGNNLLFTLSFPGQDSNMKIAVQSLRTGKRKELFAGAGARYLDTGHLVYVQGGSLFAVPFDADTLEVTGGSVPMVQGIAGLPPRYAISDSGALIYVQGEGGSSEKNILVWVDRNGREEAIDAPPRAYTYTHLSPDGTQVALDIRDQQYDIWIWDLARRTLARLTFDPGINRGGIWTPDGKKVAYSAERNGSHNIWLQPADGSEPPAPLTQIPKSVLIPDSFSPDGKYLLVTDVITPNSVILVHIGSSAAPEKLLASEFTRKNPQISPDGRWLVYESYESGRPEIYVRPFPNVNAGRWQISTEGGTRPLWNKNGREIFYFLPPGIMMSVPVETGVSFKDGTPRVLFKGEYLTPQDRTPYSVTPDGQRFLMIKDASAKPGSTAPAQINVVLNWTEELKQRVPVK